MADRFPLILNTSTNQIQEIPSGDNLDLTGTGINNAGIITSGNVTIGAATTDLIVTGDARITGILTIGTSSLKLDGPNNLVNVGTALTLGHTQGVQFHTQNLHSAGFEVNQINASGIITATEADINGDLDVDGHTNLDNVSVAGVSTFAGNADFSAGIDVTGNVIASGNLTANNGTVTVYGTAPKIIFSETNANPDYKLEANGGNISFVDTSNSATRLSISSSGINVTGNGTFSGNLSIGGTLTYEDVTNIDSIGIITARNGINVSSGTATFQGAIDANSDLDVDGHTNLDNVSVGGATTMSGDLRIQSASPSIYFTDTNNNPDYLLYNSNGNFEVRDVSNNGTRLQVASTGNVNIFKDLDVDGHTNLDNVSIAGVVTATSFVGALTGNATSADTVDISGAGNANTEFYVTFSDTNGAAKTIKIDDGLRYNASSNILTASYFSGNGANLSGLNGSNITSGTIPVAQIGTGTKNTSTFYRGDGTFATVTPPAITAISNATNNRIVTSEGGTTVNAEPNLTFNGQKLSIGPLDGGTDVNLMVRNTNANGYGAYISGGGNSNQYILRLDDKDQNQRFRFKPDGDMTATGIVDGGGGLRANNRFFGAGGNGNSTIIKSNASGAVALTLQDSGGNHKLELYGEGTNQGFLASAWGVWDLRKINNGDLVLRASGSNYNAIHQGNVSGNVGLQNIQVFTSNGTWNKPSGITRIKVYVTGGGGGGGSHNGDDANGGGGAGATAIEVIDVTSVSSVSVTVGSGGGGASGNTNSGAGDGNASSFGSYCTGGGGEGPNEWGIGASGGVASGGDLNLRGGYGGSGNIDGYANSEAGGNGGASFWGGGPNGGTHWGSRGTNGPYGAGGAGAHANTNNNGSDGQPGVVVIELYKS